MFYSKTWVQNTALTLNCGSRIHVNIQCCAVGSYNNKIFISNKVYNYWGLSWVTDVTGLDKVTEQDFFFFVSAVLLSTIILLFLLSSAVALSYFNLAVPMRKCLGKHWCMSSSYSIAILNGTFCLRAPILLCGDVPAIKQLGQWRFRSLQSLLLPHFSTYRHWIGFIVKRKQVRISNYLGIPINW